MMAHMKRLADESRALAATRDYLLPKLLSGEVAVDAGEEVAKTDLPFAIK